MNSSFSGCFNLQKIDFKNVNSLNLENMENTFENCTQLKSLNLSSLYTNNLKSTHLKN